MKLPLWPSSASTLEITDGIGIYGENVVQTYVVCVHRASLGMTGPVSRTVGDIESDQKEAFQNYDELESMLVCNLFVTLVSGQ